MNRVNFLTTLLHALYSEDTAIPCVYLRTKSRKFPKIPAKKAK